MTCLSIFPGTCIKLYQLVSAVIRFFFDCVPILYKYTSTVQKHPTMRTLYLILCLLTGVAALPGRAQDSESGLPEKRYLSTFRFQVLNGGIILGKVKMKGFPDSLNFIFDTGCGGA